MPVEYLVGIIFALVNVLFWYIINGLHRKNAKMQNQIECLQKEVQEMKFNYISRFEEVKELMFNNTREILNRLDEFKLLVVEHYQKKTDCKCNK